MSAQSHAIRSITIRYYLVGASYSFGPFIIMAVYPLFLHSRGLDQFQINLVYALYVSVTFVTDVPTGAFADAVGGRTAVVTSCALHAAAFAIYFLSHQYWQFIIAACADGLGTTFGNGPIDAWAIDALDGAGFEGPKDALFSRRYQIAQIIGMAATIAGAYLAQFNIAAPFILNAMVWSGAGLVALSLMEGGGAGKSRTMNEIAHEVRRRSIDSTRLGFADRNIRWLSVAGLLGALLWYGWGMEWQQFFKQGLHTGMGGLGWVQFAIILAQVAGLEVAARLSGARYDRALSLAAGTGIATACVIIAGRAHSHMTFALAAVMTATFTMGVIGPMGFAWFNEIVQGENRATLLSFNTAMSTLGGIIGLPMQGKLVDAFGAGTAWQIAGLISMTQVFCFLAVRTREDLAAQPAGS